MEQLFEIYLDGMLLVLEMCELVSVRFHLFPLPGCALHDPSALSKKPLRKPSGMGANKVNGTSVGNTTRLGETLKESIVGRRGLI